MNKKALRTLYRQRRLELSDSQRSRLDDLLLIQFQHLPLPDIEIVLSYWPAKEKGEVNTHLMADYMAFRNPGLRLAFPVANFEDHTMQAIAVEGDTAYMLNQYDIAEPQQGTPLLPADIDMIFVPLLVCDLNGYRVGYGKGFYDRYLAACREDVLKIGFCYFDPVDEIDDVDEFDVPLDICITPNRLYEF